MVMKNFLLGLSKFVLGIILAMLIMSLAGLSMARYFMTRIVEDPERPTYDNDLPEAPRPVATTPQSEPARPEVFAPAPEPEPEPAYSEVDRATVNQPVGLILRSGPGTNYRNIGGVEYLERVDVIGEEGGWLNVILSNGEEGWIVGGNVDWD